MEPTVSDDKKAHILRMLPLGIDFYTACIQARLTLDQIDCLEKDASFQRECDYSVKAEEYRLLMLYSTTVDNAAREKLDHKGLRDRLELVNPSKYSKNAIAARSGANDPDENKNTSVHIYMPDNGRNSGH